jgi:hypothetical protein
VSTTSVQVSSKIHVAPKESAVLPRESAAFFEETFVNLDLIGPTSPIIVLESTWEEKLKVNHQFK